MGVFCWNATRAERGWPEALVQRLGNSRTVRVDVRVVAATNRKLPDLIRAGTFRQDLY